MVYVQPPMDYTESHAAFSVTHVTVPLLMFFGALVSVIWFSVLATRTASTLESSMYQGFDRLTTTLNNYIARNDERAVRIEEGMERRERMSWTKQDQRLFCAETSALPENKGWRCADPGEAPIWRGLGKGSSIGPVPSAGPAFREGG